MKIKTRVDVCCDTCDFVALNVVKTEIQIIAVVPTPQGLTGAPQTVQHLELPAGWVQTIFQPRGSRVVRPDGKIELNLAVATAQEIADKTGAPQPGYRCRRCVLGVEGEA